MKKEVTLLVIGLILVVVGALLKIQHIQSGQYIMIAGLALEAFTLGSLVLKSLKK
jgi:hypothetical protein